MRPAQILRASAEKKPGQYLGPWGAIGSMPQKGIIHYGVAPNRQKPLAGVVNAAIFNTFRRTRDQILYWSVPLLIAYMAMDWATKKNEFLNSKEGRKLHAGEE